MKPFNVFIYLVAFLFPLIFFLVITNNLNERKPWLVFLLCIPLFAIAGLLTSTNKFGKARWQWIATSLLIGLAEALGLVILA